MRRVFGIGETILDIIFKDNKPCKAVPGGSAFNGLVSLGRAGVPVTFISELGNDKVGKIIKEFMGENNISTEYIDCFPDGKSPVSLAFLEESHQTEYAIYSDYPQQRLEIPFPRINEDDIFFFGAYYALNPVLRERMLEFVQYAKERKAIIYYDPNFRKPHAHEVLRLMPALIENLEFADIVRGSDEDFFNLFGKTDTRQVYEEHIRFYCDRFIATHAHVGVSSYNNNSFQHFDVPSIQPLSTVGAGDNFNAGIIYGLLKYDIRQADIAKLDEQVWKEVIQCGIDFATECCLTFDNFISIEFAKKLRMHS